MHFELEEDHLILQEQVRRFATEKLSPLTSTLAHASLPLDDLLVEIAALGLRGPRVDMNHDGMELDATSDLLILEEIARQDAGLALVLANHNLGAFAMSLLDHPWTNLFTSGEQWLCTAFIDEPGTTDHRLDLTLDFVSGASALTHALLITPTRFLLATLSHESVTTTPLKKSLGLRSCSPCRITFTQTPVETLQQSAKSASQAEHVHHLLHATHHAHLGTILTALGRSAYEVGANYAFDRKQFDRRLTDFQVTQFKLATIYTNLTAAHHLVRLAGHQLTTSPADALSTALQAHGLAITATRNACDESLQLHGGYGYTSEYAIERHYRDALTIAAIDGGKQRADRRAGEQIITRGQIG